MGIDLKKELNKGKEAVTRTEADIDSWLVRWAKGDYSLGIAICFGLILLGIGGLIGQAL